MHPALGRPRTACSTCKNQKIRCTLERPSCKRCLRLKHACSYTKGAAQTPGKPKLRQASASKRTDLYPSPPSTASQTTGSEALRNQDFSFTTLAPHTGPSGAEDCYLGISKTLISILVDLYFDNVYNAYLLLHKSRFLESLARETVSSHVLLSVCAWGANFYRDSNGTTSLRDQGLTKQWAKQAGQLVFREAEDLCEDNVVTFCNLALFWHSQGSWRISYLYKGNACQLLNIIGLGPAGMSADKSLELEIRRRRFWACYLMDCQSCERRMLFEQMVDMSNLALPWPEDDYASGASTSPYTTLESVQRNGGISSELITAIRLWSSVLSLIKCSRMAISEKITSIHALDEKLSAWWQNMPAKFVLTSSSIASLSLKELPKILYVNLIYHQSLCALHACIVPLFCWGPSDQGWSAARQLSAQLAFEHAAEASELLSAVLSTFSRLSSMPCFVAYAAYCGCAIQIPFMWCLNSTVKQQAQSNVKANIRMIDAMSDYWEFAKLLKIHVRCLYQIRARHPVVLENEPKYLDAGKLTTSRISATNARASIFEYTGVLRSNRGGWAKPGEEKDFQIQEDSSGEEADSPMPTTESNQGSGVQGEADMRRCPGRDSTPSRENSRSLGNMARSTPPSDVKSSRNQVEHAQLELQQGSPDSSYSGNAFPIDLPIESQTFDIFHPVFDTEMLDLYPDSHRPDFSLFEGVSLNLDYYNLDGWDTAPAPSGAQEGASSMTATGLG